uniref:Uncharacterized protein n=1 Tax=Plectus sambesii TaxID=2011161 RepID=A0A914URM9_9BILA
MSLVERLLRSLSLVGGKGERFIARGAFNTTDTRFRGEAHFDTPPHRRFNFHGVVDHVSNDPPICASSSVARPPSELATIIIDGYADGSPVRIRIAVNAHFGNEIDDVGEPMNDKPAAVNNSGGGREQSPSRTSCFPIASLDSSFSSLASRDKEEQSTTECEPAEIFEFAANPKHSSKEDAVGELSEKFERLFLNDIDEKTFVLTQNTFNRILRDTSSLQPHTDPAGVTGSQSDTSNTSRFAFHQQLRKKEPSQHLRSNMETSQSMEFSRDFVPDPLSPMLTSREKEMIFEALITEDERSYNRPDVGSSAATRHSTEEIFIWPDKKSPAINEDDLGDQEQEKEPFEQSTLDDGSSDNAYVTPEDSCKDEQPLSPLIICTPNATSTPVKMAERRQRSERRSMSELEKPRESEHESFWSTPAPTDQTIVVSEQRENETAWFSALCGSETAEQAEDEENEAYVSAECSISPRHRSTTDTNDNDNNNYNKNDNDDDGWETEVSSGELNPSKLRYKKAQPNFMPSAMARRRLRQEVPSLRLNEEAVVMAAAAVGALTAELIALSTNAACEEGGRLTQSRHIRRAVAFDNDFSVLLSDVIIPLRDYA